MTAYTNRLGDLSSDERIWASCLTVLVADDLAVHLDRLWSAHAAVVECVDGVEQERAVLDACQSSPCSDSPVRRRCGRAVRDLQEQYSRLDRLLDAVVASVSSIPRPLFGDPDVVRAFRVESLGMSGLEVSDPGGCGLQLGHDRIGLIGLLESAKTGQFDVVLVDDLSRLARDNQLLQSLVAELGFHAVHVVSVADGLDSGDEDAMFAIQMRGVFNQLFLTDLRQKTLRGQRGQKERGFFVAEAIFGYRSRPVGEVRLDRRGRYRPQGYTMGVEPDEARVVVRIYTEYAEGRSAREIARSLAREGAPSPVRVKKGWLPSTVTGVLDNTKYVGRWVWNKTRLRRDPRTGRCRQVPKPESEWVVVEDESLRIISQALWDRVRGIRQSSRREWRKRSGCTSAKT